MPWDVKKDSRCSASKPWGVVKKGDKTLEGCHPSEAAAKKQQAALYVSEAGRSLAEEQDVTDEPEGRIRSADLFRASCGEGFVSFRDDGVEGTLGTLKGRFASFGEWAEINNSVEGHFMERISDRALEKTVSENRDNIRVLFHHGLDPSVGVKPLGPIEELRGDSSYRVSLIDTPYNRDLLPGLRANLYGASFRFNVVKEEYVQRPERSDSNPTGLPESTVTEVKIKEFGPTPFPAYKGATASMRSLTDEIALASVLGSPILLEPEAVRRLLEAVALRSEEEPDAEGRTTPDPDESRSTAGEEANEEREEEQPSWLLRP